MEFKMIYSTIAIFLGIITGNLLKPDILEIFYGTVLLLIIMFLNRKSNNIRIVFLITILFFFSMTEYILISNYESRLKKYEGEMIDVNIIVLEEGNKRNNVSAYIAECTEVVVDNKVCNCREKIIFKSYSKCDYKSGDIVKARGNLEGIIGKRNFGDNDIELYYNSKRIYNQFNSWNNNKVSKSNDYRVLLFYNVRNRITNIINESLPKEEAAFLNAVIIGDKHYLDNKERDNYSKVGLAHILSISGLHVAFIVYLISQSLKALKVKDSFGDVICSLLIIYYVIMIGAPPPALRSLIMMIVLIWGKYIKRDYDMKASASFAAAIMLLYNPLLIHNQGFIISFACIYSIAFLYEPVYKLLGKIIVILPIRKAFALSLSIQIGITPILIYFFNYLSLLSIFINIIAIPLVFVIIATGFIGVIVSAFIQIIGIYIFSVDYYFIHILSKIISIAASLPLSGFFIPSLSLLVYLLYYLIIIMAFFRDENICIYLRSQKHIVFTTLLIIFLFVFSRNMINENIRLVFLDVGQGDSSLITTSRGKHILLDGGGSAAKGDYYFDVGSKITVPSLLKLGVWSIDTIIVSHIHEDHLEGLIKTIESFKVGKAILPDTPFESDISKKFIELCEEKGIRIIYAKEGDKLFLDKNTEIEFVFPEKLLIRGTKSDENNNSIVAKLKYKNFKVLYTGDIEKDAERRLLNKNISAEIIKIPHHGSNSSSTEEFIEAVSPKISIISVGKNTFGHPSQEVIKRLNGYSQAVFRTDYNGAISLKSDGNKVIIKTVRKHDKN